MDQVKFDQLKHEISNLRLYNERLGSELEKFCLDPSVPQDSYEELLDFFRSARSIGAVSGYDIEKARWKARIFGREFNAKSVCREKPRPRG